MKDCVNHQEEEKEDLLSFSVRLAASHKCCLVTVLLTLVLNSKGKTAGGADRAEISSDHTVLVRAL